MTTHIASVLLVALVACTGSDAAPAKSAPAKSAPAKPPAASAFVTGSETAAAEDVVAVGDAHVALVATGAAHNTVVVRSLLAGKPADVTRVATGDCSGGTIAELWTAKDGTVVAKLGQLSYSSCDDDAEGVKKPDLDSHVECVALSWDAAGKKVTVAKKSPRAKSDTDLPAWCAR